MFTGSSTNGAILVTFTSVRVVVKIVFTMRAGRACGAAREPRETLLWTLAGFGVLIRFGLRILSACSPYSTKTSQEVVFNFL